MCIDNKSKLQAPMFIEQPSASSIVAEGGTKFMQCKAKGSNIKIKCFSMFKIIKA